MEWQLRITPAESSEETGASFDWAVHSMYRRSDWNREPVVNGVGGVSFDDLAYWMTEAGFSDAEVNDAARILRQLDPAMVEPGIDWERGNQVAREVLADLTDDDQRREFAQDDLSDEGKSRGREITEEPEEFHLGWEAAMRQVLDA